MKTEEFEKAGREIFKEIEKAQNILLHLHPSPDPDSAGSALAMAEVCRELGKKTTVIKGDSNFPRSLESLPNAGEVVAKEYSEVDLSLFDLFIILDSGDLNRITNNVKVDFPTHLKTINIDHHATNPHYGNINLVDSSKPATAQILAKLFLLWQVGITPAMATNLFTGIYTDTGGFRYRGVSKETFELAGYLYNIAPETTEVLLFMERQKSPKALVYKSLALASATAVGDGKGVVAGLSWADFEAVDITPEDVEGLSISNELLSVKDYLVAVTVMEKEAGKCRVSFRSKDEKEVDVSEVAASLGGGGHKMAAGALILKPFAEAKKDVIEALEKVLG